MYSSKLIKLSKANNILVYIKRALKWTTIFILIILFFILMSEAVVNIFISKLKYMSYKLGEISKNAINNYVLTQENKDMLVEYHQIVNTWVDTWVKYIPDKNLANNVYKLQEILDKEMEKILSTGVVYLSNVEKIREPFEKMLDLLNQWIKTSFIIKPRNNWLAWLGVAMLLMTIFKIAICIVNQKVINIAKLLPISQEHHIINKRLRQARILGIVGLFCIPLTNMAQNKLIHNSYLYLKILNIKDKNKLV